MDYVNLTFHEVMQLCHDVWGDSLSEAIRHADNFTDMTCYGKVIKSGTGFDSTYQFPAKYWTQNELRAVGVTTNAGRASEAWYSYASTAGSTISETTGGAKVAVKEATSVTTGWIKKPPTDLQRPSAYQASTILKMPVSSVAAAAAPLAGIALGAEWYNENPELWTKLSQALVPWLYPDNPVEEGFADISKGLMPVWTDVAEAGGELVARAILPDFVVDAVKNLFSDEGIGRSSDKGFATSPVSGGQVNFIKGQTWTVGESSRYVLYPGTFQTWSKANRTIIYASATDGYAGKRYYNGQEFNFESLNRTYTRNGLTVHYYRANVGESSVDDGLYGDCPKSYNTAGTDQTAWTMVYGQITYDGNFPAGTSQYGDGSQYPLPSNPTQIVTTDSDGNEVLIDGYPVPLPFNPGQTSDPSQQDIDDPIQDPSKQADPYIQRTPDPYSDPSPSPDPPGQPDPKTDPSQKTDPSSPISPTSPTPLPPASDGETPTPIPPVIPPPFTSEGGLIAVYNPPQSTLVAFANWLWVTYQDATIQKIWNNPFDGVISLHELYCTPPVIGSRSIKSGFLDSEIVSPIIGRYTEINCGNIVIPEYWGNYLDYAPYSKAFVYLPFIGIIELEADDIVGHAVNITYRIDCYNGSCIAMITVAKQGPRGEIYSNTVYQYSGNCAVEVPLSGGSQASIKAAIINATAWGLGSVISGLVTAAGTGPIAGLAGAGQAITGALQATASVVNAKSSVQHSGTFGASFGAMGIKKPYIIVKRPIQVQVLNYNEIYGYQAHKAVTIGSCEGYLRCREVHVTSATANDEEKQLIEQYLKTGVIV